MKCSTYLLLIAAIAMASLVLGSCNCSDPGVSNPEVGSESLKDLLEDQEAAWDSVPPSPEEVEHVEKRNERIERSEFKTMNDAELEAQVRTWLKEYSGTCDVGVYDKYMNAMKTELPYQAWRGTNRKVFKGLSNQWKAARDSCSNREL